jgi:hypothetical protein
MTCWRWCCDVWAPTVHKVTVNSCAQVAACVLHVLCGKVAISCGGHSTAGSSRSGHAGPGVGESAVSSAALGVRNRFQTAHKHAVRPCELKGEEELLFYGTSTHKLPREREVRRFLLAISSPSWCVACQGEELCIANAGVTCVSPTSVLHSCACGCACWSTCRSARLHQPCTFAYIGLRLPVLLLCSE